MEVINVWLNFETLPAICNLSMILRYLWALLVLGLKVRPRDLHCKMKVYRSMIHLYHILDKHFPKYCPDFQFWPLHLRLHLYQLIIPCIFVSFVQVKKLKMSHRTEQIRRGVGWCMLLPSTRRESESPVFSRDTTFLALIRCSSTSGPYYIVLE